MFALRSMVLVTVFSLLTGCAEGLYRRKDPNNSGNLSSNWIPVYWLGMRTADTKDGKLVIVNISSDSPAQTAGMQVGDEITAVNGRKMSNEELYALMHFNRGEAVSLTINRHCFETDHTIQPAKIFSTPPTFVKIKELLSIDKRTVRIAVIVGDVQNTMQGSFDRRLWEESVRKQHRDQIENDLLRNFAEKKTFSLVDRARSDKVLGERTIGMFGSVSEDARRRIGEMTGATHIFIAKVTRYPENRHGNFCLDEYEHRLIDIENGQVLAIDQQGTRACR
jgi:membrane-associated protease RseP (regulator of RpoE activity)